MMNKNRFKIGSLLMVTTMIFLSFTIGGNALDEQPRKEDAPALIMERVTDFFSGDNFNIIQDTRERLEELAESIGRGTERIGESVEKLTDFIGFDLGKDDEGIEENQGEQEKKGTGQVVGTFTSKDGQGFENIRVNLGNYATYTDSEGAFQFDEIPYGVYTLSYQESQGEALNNIEEILIDGDNNRHVVRMVVDRGDEGEILGEGDSSEEILVDSLSEPAPEDGGLDNENENRGVLGFIILMFVVLVAIAIFFVINRKHIKIIDGGTGETLRKKKVDIKPVTWIDLTEEFQEASQEKIRIRFIRSAIRKLCGKKVVFTVDDQLIAEIPEYTGELDFLVQRKSVIQENKEPEE